MSRTRAPLLLAILLGAAILPHVGAYQSTPRVLWQNDHRQGNTADVWWATSPSKIVKDGCCTRIEGSGGVEFFFYVSGPDALGADSVAWYLDLQNDNAGACNVRIYRWSDGSNLFDSAQPCTRRGWIWSNDNVQQGNYVVRITCSGSCWTNIQSVRAEEYYNGLTIDVAEPYYGVGVNGLQVSTQPGYCLPITALGSPAHRSVVDVDWGDGSSQTFTLPTTGWAGNTVCHSYAPQTIPYQACARVRETNGLYRATPTDCRNVPGSPIPRV